MEWRRRGIFWLLLLVIFVSGCSLPWQRTLDTGGAIDPNLAMVIYVAVLDRKNGTGLTDLFPEPLEPSMPSDVQITADGKLAYLLHGAKSQDHPLRDEYRKSGRDERLLAPHIDVWEMTSHKVIRQIFLPSVQPVCMVLASDVRLFVGYEGSTNSVSHISVIDPQSGQGQRLFVGSEFGSLVGQ